MISLAKFKKSAGEVDGSLDAWLYLLNHAGDGKELPDFGNEVLGEALERIRVDNADDELLTKQERDMVTQEELDTIIASRVLRGVAKGHAEGRAEGIADAETVLRKKGLPENLIAEIQVELEAMRQERLK